MTHSINPESLFVSPQQLEVMRHSSKILVLDASWHMPSSGRNAHEEYLNGHIPGAVFFDIDAISNQETDLPHMLPSAKFFSHTMSKIGLSNECHAIIYDSLGLFSAPRLWWTLQVFGMRKVSILMGGLPAWKSEGLPLEKGPVKSCPKQFEASFDATLVAEALEVASALKSGETQVLDARSTERFRGEVNEPRPGLRSGHMPGALNLPFQRLIEFGCLLPKENLEAVLKGSGLDLEKPVIVTCGSGLTACILSLAVAATGRTIPKVYDGSWSEWGGTEILPVEKS
jgi:thiosulfate/3-mercaptopyruvate sulfurtransferase